MTSCVFHESSAATQERQLFEIVEQAFNQRQKVLIFAGDPARAASIDRILWVLKQEAFIPHRVLAAGEQDSDLPVAIVHGEANPISADILIAVGHCSLEFACTFSLVHEFVDRSTPEIHQACRDRFRDYRSRQVPVEYSK